MGIHGEVHGQQPCVLRVAAGRSSFFKAAVSTAVFVLFLMPLRISAQGQPDVVWSGNYSTNVTSVAYAPDGQTVFSGNGDKAGNLWRASDETFLRKISFSEIGCGTI